MDILVGFTILLYMHGVKCWDLELQGRTHLKTGDKLSLTCNGTSLDSPLANLDWYRDSTKLKPDKRVKIRVSTKIMESARMVSSTLTIRDVRKSDEGRYICWISDEIRKDIFIKISGDTEEGERPSSFGTVLRPADVLFVATFCNLYLALSSFM